MIGLDTNILVRYLANDDPVNSPKADRIMRSLTASDPGWISITAMAETIWILTRRFKVDRANVGQIVDELLGLPEILIEQRELVRNAVDLYRASAADFSDCLVSCSGSTAGCRTTLTFDRKAARHAGMTLAS
jgi:predicted nucleic-acid-binding protein